jgi:1-acyl-sn-glycerol-3-phosphate acyltransferase
MIRAIPWSWRKNLVVAAAADYFFDKSWKAVMSALALNAIPIDREVTGRKASDMFRDLLADGHSLLIYPEGGRSPDGWGQSFKGGAAYLSSRSGAPVVPVFIDGTGSIFGKGMKRPARAHEGRVRDTTLAIRRREHAATPDRGSRHDSATRP